MRISSLFICVSITSSAIIGVGYPSFAGPRLEQSVTNDTFSTAVTIGEFSSDQFAIQPFDNSRRTLRSSAYDISFTATLSGVLSSSTEVPRGVDFGAFDGGTTFSIEALPPATLQWNIPLDCEPTDGTEPCGSFSAFQSFSLGSYNLTTSSDELFGLDQIGSAVDVASQLNWLPFTPSNHTGRFVLDGTVTATHTFDAKTSREYALEALTTAQERVDNLDVVDQPSQLGREFYQDAIRLREGDEPYSNVNLNIRDVEYFARGYSGGQLISEGGRTFGDEDLKNDIANVLVPISAPLYNLIKEVFGEDALRPENAGPASEAGGTEEAIAGWLSGLSGAALETAIRARFPGPQSVPAPQPLQLRSLDSFSISSSRPNSDDPSATEAAAFFTATGPSPYFKDDREINLSYFKLTDATESSQFDFYIDYGDFFSVSTIGTDISRFSIGGSSSGGGSLFEMIIGDSRFSFSSGEWVDLSTVDYNGSASSILFRNLGETLDQDRILFNSYFGSADQAYLASTSFSYAGSSVAPVPIPASLPFFIGGLASLWTFTRKRRTT